MLYLDRVCLGEIVKHAGFQEEFGASKESIGQVLGAFFLFLCTVSSSRWMVERSVWDSHYFDYLYPRLVRLDGSHRIRRFIDRAAHCQIGVRHSTGGCLPNIEWSHSQMVSYQIER